MRIDTLEEKFNRFEPYFFLLVTIVHLLPLLVLKFFPSLDGPAHLHNANLIQHLLIEGHSNLGTYYEMNQLPVPNWTGHLILILFNLFLPGFLAEKILVVVYVLGFAFSFRYLVSLINTRNIVLSYFSFPFMYSFVFFMGFYNFSIGVVFMILTLAFWVKHEDRLASLRIVAGLSGLLLITYFSHIVVFSVLVFLLFLRIVYTILGNFRYERRNFLSVMGDHWSRIKGLIIAFALPAALLLYYILSRPIYSDYKYKTTTELLNWIHYIRPLISFHFSIEKPYTITLFYLLCFLTIIGLYYHWFKSGNRKKPNTYTFSSQWFPGFWLLSAGIIFGIYLFFPDSNGASGYISVRLCYFFFLLVILWLTTQRLPFLARLLGLVIILFANFGSNAYYYKTFHNLNEKAVSSHKAAAFVEPEALILPIMKGKHWMTGHFSNYLGIDKPAVILENYECSNGYFPLKWNSNEFPKTLFGGKTSNDLSCLRWRTNDQNEPERIDYVYLLGDLKVKKDSCQKTVKSILVDHYKVAYKDENCRLYKLKAK